MGARRAKAAICLLQLWLHLRLQLQLQLWLDPICLNPGGVLRACNQLICVRLCVFAFVSVCLCTFCLSMYVYVYVCVCLTKGTRAWRSAVTVVHRRQSVKCMLACNHHAEQAYQQQRADSADAPSHLNVQDIKRHRAEQEHALGLECHRGKQMGSWDLGILG